jgi:hypothetical protein
MRRYWEQIGLVCSLTAFLALSDVSAQPRQSPDRVWTALDHTPEAVMAGPQWIRPTKYAAAAMDLASIQALLHEAPLENSPRAAESPLTMFLPMPNGSFAGFEIVESPIMEPGLAAQFPEIKTYRGWGLTDRGATVRMDLTPLGFHAQILSPNGAVYIDPVARNNVADYASYYKRDYVNPGEDSACRTIARAAGIDAPRGADEGGDPRTSNGTTLITYRLACAATAEYTAFFGGTVPLGQAAVVTAINRVDGIYETELSIKLVLVANNSSLIFTNSMTDPYTNGSPATMVGENQTACDSIILSANYDIGHVLGSPGGGIAAVGVVGLAGQKAQGASARTTPMGDPFYIDFVAHEMGHQFGANHAYNGSNGSCSANRNNATAYEPGSGSTIMCYAGICGTDNLQAHDDPYFHSESLDEIVNYVATIPSVGTHTVTGNAIPTASAGSNYTIPKNTPFTLTATGNDANGDMLTYCWEERDLGGEQALVSPDDGASPICRSWSPLTSPSRTIPRLAELLNNTLPLGEKLPALARSMHWRVVVRDNRVDGAVRSADMILTVDGASGPFQVTSPNTAVSWTGTQTITWNVAGTNGIPVSCSSVKISLSTDGGNTFPTVLAASTPNDGSQIVTLPEINNSQARIKLESVGNVFFDISNTNFSIVPGTTDFENSGAVAVVDPGCSGNGNATNQLDPGETADILLLGVLNNGAGNATGISASLISLTPTVTVISGSSTYPDMINGGSGVNDTPFVVSISPSHPCGSIVNFQLTVNSNQGSNNVSYVLGTGCTPPLTPCLGDMNLDHSRDGLDVQMFVGCVLGDGTNCLCGDFDSSGAAGLSDVPDFVTALLDGTVCP